MKGFITMIIAMLIVLTANAEICTVTLSGDWSASTLRIKEPAGGLDTVINSTSPVWFRGSGNATFIYYGINNQNTFSYDNCAGISYQSPVLNDSDVYISNQPLPVELAYFAGMWKDQNINLFWRTASEQNNKGFEVQKSKDGNTFEKIGFTKGNGTTVDVTNYNFIDRSPSNGINYYRLKQIDFDGKFEYSKIIAVAYEKSMTINQQVSETIYFNEYVENAELYDIHGRLVKRCDGTQMTVAHLPNSIYFLRANGKSYKILKM